MLVFGGSKRLDFIELFTEIRRFSAERRKPKGAWTKIVGLERYDYGERTTRLKEEPNTRRAAVQL